MQSVTIKKALMSNKQRDKYKKVLICYKALSFTFTQNSTFNTFHKGILLYLLIKA